MINDEIPVGNLGAILVHEPNPLPIRLYVLNLLREKAITKPFTYDTVRAVRSIAAGLYSEPLILKLKCVQALAESRCPEAVSPLQEQMAETENDVVCRVEAAKGLALMRDLGQEVQSTVDLLTVRYDDDSHRMIRDAAEVAAARLGWEKDLEESDFQNGWYGKPDVAPPFSTIPVSDQEDPITYFTNILLSETSSLFTQCRAMVSLRNLCIITSADGSSAWADPTVIYDVVDEMTRAVHHSESAFLRYEMVLILGQIGDQSALPYLRYQARTKSGEDERVRNAAREVLESFDGEEEWTEEHDDDDEVDEEDEVPVQREGSISEGSEESELSELSELSEEDEIAEVRGKTNQLKFRDNYSDEEDYYVFTSEWYTPEICNWDVSA